VPGTFDYSPPAGTVLPAGMGQSLTAVFTPTDAIDYQNVDAGTTLNVLSPTTPPALTGVSPAAGPNTGGTLVTITGTNLAGATAVNFGPIQITSFTSDTASQIILLSPAGTGSVPVTVTTAAGTSAISPADQFSYFLSQQVSTNMSAVSGGGTTGGTATLVCILAASSAPLAGKTVVFTLSEGGTAQTVGTATTDANGIATLTGVSLAGVGAGI
jgi:IPT/TIG domain